MCDGRKKKKLINVSSGELFVWGKPLNKDNERQSWLHEQREEEDTERQQRQEGERTAEKGRGGGGSSARGSTNMQRKEGKWGGGSRVLQRL